VNVSRTLLSSVDKPAARCDSRFVSERGMMRAVPCFALLFHTRCSVCLLSQRSGK
jgi:hypothetical protein